jgi:hypothetical protein
MLARPLVIAGLLLVTACGKGTEGGGSTPPAADASGTATPGVVEAAAGDAPAATESASAASLAGRTRTLSNPDDFTMVLLYYSLSGAKPSVDKWIEDDATVRYAPPADRDGARKALRQKIEAGLAAAHDVGLVRLTMDANLSDFDPSYNEYTIRAISPSSVVYFKSFGEQVSVKFDNAEKAQRWSIDPKEAQSIRDRVQYGSGATIELLARITGTTPDASAGTINTTIISYELKAHRDGSTLARVTL